MILLHTADLHLGLHRSGVDRWDDHMRVLTEILACAEDRGVDVLLFAGDIFNNRTKRELADVATEFLRMLVPTLRRGTDVVLVLGNHDSRDLFRLMATLLRDVAGEDSLPLLICHEPRVYELSHHRNLQIVALPYLRPEVWQSGRTFPAGVVEGTELHRHLGTLVERVLDWLSKQVDPRRPAVFAGHILVAGSQATTGIELDYAHEIAIAAQSLPGYTQYNALGHVHLCQRIDSAIRPSWYAGAPDRQDRGECAYTPCVLLVELDPEAGRACEPEEVPIRNATAFVNEYLDGSKGVACFLDAEQPRTVLGTVQVTCPTTEFPGLRQQILSLYPRLDVIIAPTDAAHPTLLDLPEDPYDVHANVVKYMEDRFSGEELRQLQDAFAELYGEVRSHEN